MDRAEESFFHLRLKCSRLHQNRISRWRLVRRTVAIFHAGQASAGGRLLNKPVTPEKLYEALKRRF